jgi:TolA-binding protein
MSEEVEASDPRQTPAYAALQVAECALRRGEFDRAKALFSGVAERFPESLQANDAVERRLFLATHFAEPRPVAEAYLRALNAGGAEQREAALAQLHEIAAMGATEPLSDDAALLAASLLEASGRTGEAAAAYRALPEAFPDSLLAPETLLHAARLARSLGETAQAEEDLRTLLRNHPASPMAKVAALWLDDLQQGRPWSPQ